MSSSTFGCAAQIGPPRPIPGIGSPEDLAARLHGLLDSYSAAPFTLQRICEVLLEPRKQYSRLDKVVSAEQQEWQCATACRISCPEVVDCKQCPCGAVLPPLLQGLAIEKLLTVTSCMQPAASPPPLPALASLGPVNDNPFSPYQDGRPPSIVQPQQHERNVGDSSSGRGMDLLHGGRPDLAGGLANGPQPQAGSRDAFTYFLDAEIVAAGAGGALPGSAAVALIGPQPMEAGTPPSPASVPLTAAEQARAEAFVEAALGDAPAGTSNGDGEEGGSGSVDGEPTPPMPESRQGIASPESVPPTPEGPASRVGQGSSEEATAAAAEGTSEMDMDAPTAGPDASGAEALALPAAMEGVTLPEQLAVDAAAPEQPHNASAFS